MDKPECLEGWLTLVTGWTPQEVRHWSICCTTSSFTATPYGVSCHRGGRITTLVNYSLGYRIDIYITQAEATLMIDDLTNHPIL